MTTSVAYQKRQLSALTDIVNKDCTRVGSVVDFMLSNIKPFMETCKHMGISEQAVLSFALQAPKFHEKVDAFVATVAPKDFYAVKDSVSLLMDSRTSRALSKKYKEIEAYESLAALRQFMETLDYGRVSFLGSDNYSKYKDELRALNAVDTNTISSKLATNFIRGLFAAEGVLEWSVDGPSRVQSAKCLLPFYRSPKLFELTSREFKKSPKLAAYVGQQMVDVINSITEWSLRPTDTSARSTFSAQHQDTLLNICTEVINLHCIPVHVPHVMSAKYFEDDCQFTAQNNGYKMPSKEKFAAVQKRLNEFKTSVKKHHVAPTTK